MSPTCILDLTYRLGTWKKVATGVAGGGDDGRTIGGSVRLASILELNDQVIDIMEVFEIRIHCPMDRRKVCRTNHPNIPSFFDDDVREGYKTIAH